MASKPNLTSKLAKTYQQLQKAQSRVAELEAQLSEAVAKLAHLENNEPSISETRDFTANLQNTALFTEAILNNSPEAILLANSDLTIRQGNASFNRLFGIEWDAYFGKSILALIHPVDASGRNNLAQIAVAQNTRLIEAQAIRKDGTTFDAELSIVVIEGNGLLCTIRDIAENKTGERQLHDHTSTKESVSEARYRLLAENIADVIMTFSLDRRITYMSPSCEKLLGYSPAEIEGKSHSDFIHPDDYPQVINRTRQAVASRENFYTNQFRLRHKTGHYIWYEVRTRVIYDQTTGNVEQFISVLRDIADRKHLDDALRESEDRFRRAIIDAPFPIMLHADDGTILHISNAWASISGYTHAEIPTMNDWLEKAYRENSQAVKPVIAKVYSLTEARRGGEFMIWTKSGEERIWDFISAPLTRTLDGRQVVSSMAMDITERKHAEEALKDKVAEEHQFQAHLKALHEIIIELTGIDELDAFYKRVVELGRERLGLERLAMFLYDEQDGSAIGTFGIDTEGQVTDERGLRFTPDPNGIMQRSYERAERFYINEQSTLFNAEIPVGHGWNAAATLWKGTRTLGWLVADNLLSHKPATKSLLDIIGLYALSIGSLLAQKQTQLALRESDALHRLLAENVNDVIMRLTLTSECLYISPSVQTMLGYLPEELNGQLTSDLIHPDDKAIVWNAYDSALNQNTHIMSHQYRVRHKDGHYVWLETVGKPLHRDGTNDIHEIVTSSRDITERKRISAELEQQRSFLRNVIDVSPSMIFVKDYDARFVLANPQVAKMYDTTVEALLGKSDADFDPNMKEVDDFLTADRRVITSGEPLFVEEPITNYYGRIHWLQTTKVPLVSTDGSAKYVLGVSTDITERKEAEVALRDSENKYRSLIETVRGGLVTFDTEFRVTYVNDRFCELLGYSREEAIGKQPTYFVDTAHIPLVQSQLERLQNSESTSYEVLVRHANGQLLHMLMAGSPLLDKQGKYNGSIVVATDITIQKQAEEALRQALVKEKDLGDLKTRFVSMASHEFRTPLATILALVETVSAYRKKLSEEQIDQRLDKIKDQVSHLKDIMEDILMLARMQARRVEFNPAKVDVDALTRSVLDEFQNRTDIKHQLKYALSEGSHEAVIDRKLMRQIINNLVSNAIKYSPQDTVIRISLTHTDSALNLTISDEGIGIPEADLPHLFEPFHRATNVGTISGTGLGLVITKEAVDLHKGTITVESHLGIGTTFNIHIPTFGAGEKHGKQNPSH